VVPQPGEVTKLLHRWRTGDPAAESELFELLIPDLRRIAGHVFRRERQGHTLQPTAIVNEAFFRLANAKSIEWRDRGHFFAIAARVMRRYLIDYARAHPDAEMLPLEGMPERILGRKAPLDLAIAMDALLQELKEESPQQCSVVEMKFFLGLTDEEGADALNLKLHTFQREWYRARCWLFE